MENVMAAMTAVRGTVSDEAILETVRTFVGVEHRNQWVATVGGVHYYNNSIGSSPARTVATLHAHVGRVLLIAGGRDKKVPFDEMARLLPDHVKVLLLIGEAASQIEAAARRVPSCPPDFPLRRPGRGSGAGTQAGRTGRHCAAEPCLHCV